MSIHIERARLLLNQNNSEKAIESLQQALSEDADNYEAYFLLSLAYNNQKNYAKALETAETAIQKRPDLPGTHYALALAHFNKGDLKKSEAAISESLRLDVTEPDFHELLSLIHIRNKKWSEALEQSQKGLAFDPEHHGCIDSQAQALTKLKRGAEASDSIKSALSKNPHNPALHERMGWSLLEKGRPKEALNSFSEAARLDPESVSAKQGILTSLKAKNLVYALFLKYVFFMSRLDSRTQWMILIGGMLAVRFGRKMLESAGLHAGAWILTGLWMAAVFFTWAGDSIFNLLLRLHPQGKHALTQEQIKGANLCGFIISVSLLHIATAFLTPYWGLLILGLSNFLLIIPASLIFTLTQKGARIQVVVFTITLALAECYGIISGLMQNDWGQAVNVAVGTLIAIAVFSWYANFLSMKEK